MLVADFERGNCQTQNIDFHASGVSVARVRVDAHAASSPTSISSALAAARSSQFFTPHLRIGNPGLMEGSGLRSGVVSLFGVHRASGLCVPTRVHGFRFAFALESVDCGDFGLTDGDRSRSGAIVTLFGVHCASGLCVPEGVHGPRLAFT